MSPERWREVLTELLADERWVKVVGMVGGALLVAGILFLVFGGPMEPPAAGSGGVATTNGTDDSWTEIAGYIFVILGALVAVGWLTVLAWPKLRGTDRY